MNDILAWLLVGHLVGDFLLQTRWMAEMKTTRLPALAAHSAVYACAVWLASVAGQVAGRPDVPVTGLSLLGVIIVFISHAGIDRRGFVRWWCQNVTQSNNERLFAMVDQTLHCGILALVCILERWS